MKLGLKLPLAFAAALLLVLGAALYGLRSLERSLDTFGTTVQASAEAERASMGMAVAFKTQVQEWKNTLLRGKDPKALDRYWGAFQEAERDVTGRAARLADALPEGEARTQVVRFSAAHTAMGQGYRRGFEAYRAAASMRRPATRP